MRRVSVLVILVAVIVIGYALGQRHSSSQTKEHSVRDVLYYSDPMHPAYRSDKPGIAPDCGMALQPVYKDESKPLAAASSSAPSPGATVDIDRSTQQAFGIHIASVSRRNNTRIVRVVGRIVPEDTHVYRINSGVDGFIRETAGDSPGTMVTKDQKLASYYAPDFIAASSGFLTANERVPGSVTKEGARSLQNYMDRLRNLGMSDVQIKHVAETRQLPDSIEIVSPVKGVILSRNVSPGQHFERGMDFYRIADLSRVWVVAEASQQDESYLRPGGQARVISHSDGRSVLAHITGSLPQWDGTTGTVKVRLEADNARLSLRPDMLVDVEIAISLPSAVVVPADALIDVGTQTRVFVERRAGTFEPRAVETGWRTVDDVEIRKGLKPGERIVVAAAFLVDSESRLRTVVGQATPSARDASLASERAR